MRLGTQPWIGLALLTSPAAAQGSLLFAFDASAAGDNHGAAVAAGGDLDGDGRADWVVGAPLADGGGLDAGRVQAFSGATGLSLWTVTGSVAAQELGFSLAVVGDVDGDGRADVAAGGRQANLVLVLSGASGGALRVLVGDVAGDRYGAAVAALGDVDGDGVADLAVGAPGSDAGGADAGLVRIVSGANGASLRDVHGPGPGLQLGYAVAGAGDADGDGVPDLLAGTTSGANLAVLVSCATGATLRTFVGDAATDWFGTAVTGVGDVDGDGRPDVAVGAPQALLGPGYVRIFSGASGATLRTVPGAATTDLFGWSLSAAGDVDGDGRADLLVGAPFADALDAGGVLRVNAGVVRVLSGATGLALGERAGRADDELCGWSVAGGACTDGITGAPAALPGGAAYAFDCVQTPGWTSYCTGTPNSVGSGARMDATGSASLALDDLVLVASGLPPATPGLFFHGRQAAQAPFGNGFRCVAGPVVRRGVVQASAAGTAQQPFQAAGLPAAASVRPGDVVRAQFWYRNPAAGGAGFNLSDGLRILFCP